VKPVTALAAFTAGVLTETTQHECTGALDVGKRRFRCFGRHGKLDLNRALALSDNVFFYELGRALDHDHLASVQRTLGLGQPVASFPDAPTGLVPNRAHFEADGGSLHVGHTLTQAIGHNIRVTPLQMARAYAALATGKLVGPAWIPGAATGTAMDPAWKKHLPAIRAGVRHAVTDADGTAHFDGRVPDLAGKTGTAETRHAQGEPEIPLGWFAGWAPADHPRIAFAFRVEGKMGRQVAELVLEALERAASR
jgi:penicillin-binding protein 2